VQAGSKKGQKAATTKKKNAKNKSSTKSKSGKKGSQVQGSNDLTAKLFATMEKLKEVTVYQVSAVHAIVCIYLSMEFI